LLSRRNVLAAGLATPFVTQAHPSAAADPIAACRASLARLFPNSIDAVRALGAACHQGDDAATLIHALCPRADERRRLAAASVDELGAMLDAKIRADFTDGRTRRIDGWVLSETETRLFAILAG
jgi:hypothetical protein